MQHISSPYGRLSPKERLLCISCSGPDKANCVPLACAFELWGGGGGSIAQLWSLWDSMLQRTHVKRVWSKQSIIKWKCSTETQYTENEVINESTVPCVRTGKCHTFPEEQTLVRLLEAFSAASGAVLPRHATEAAEKETFWAKGRFHFRCNLWWDQSLCISTNVK